MPRFKSSHQIADCKQCGSPGEAWFHPYVEINPYYCRCSNMGCETQQLFYWGETNQADSEREAVEKWNALNALEAA